MYITLIAAMGKNGIIGNRPRIPWLGKLPRDMKHFRERTIGKTVVMGRKTFDSIGKPLVQRRNIVLTRNTEWEPPDDVVAYNNIEELFHAERQDQELMIIGGREIYLLFLPFAARIKLTVIDHDFEGDTHFPLVDESVWYIQSTRYHPADEKNQYALSFVTYLRN